MKNLPNVYVCQLPLDKQNKIYEKAREELEKLAYEVDVEVELNIVESSKLSDLTDLLGYEFLANL